MSIGKKKFSFVLMAASLAAVMLLTVLVAGEDSFAAVSKQAKAKAKAYKGSAAKIIKVSGAKYCARKGRILTGQQKVGGRYYLFNKSTGKMMTLAINKQGGKYYFFHKNGVRYNYGFKGAGTTKATIAAGIVISGAKIKPTGKATASELKKAYRYIVKKVNYSVVLTPKTSNSKWIAKYSYDTAVKRKAKCHGYAALTYAAFKALGARPRLFVGKCLFSENQKAPTEHAWVELKDGSESYIYDSVFDNTQAKGDMSYFGKLITLSEDGKTFTVDGKDHTYYPDKAY